MQPSRSNVILKGFALKNLPPSESTIATVTSRKEEIPRRATGLAWNDKGLPPLKMHVILTTVREEESPVKRLFLMRFLISIRNDNICKKVMKFLAGTSE